MMKAGGKYGPVFIVGNSRSGTTMMSRILGKNPYIFSFNELHFFENFWTPESEKRPLIYQDIINLLKKLFLIQREGLWSQKSNTYNYDNELQDVLQMLKLYENDLTLSKVFKYFLIYETQQQNKEIPCEQTGRNVFYINDILNLYPDAKIISMVRDPRDVLLSQKHKWRRRYLGAKNIPLRETLRTWFNYHPITISMLWNSAVSSSEKFLYNDNVYTLRFEDLIENPDIHIKAICRLLDVDYNPEMLEVPQVGSSSGMDLPEKEGINKSRVGNWKTADITPEEIFICQKITQSYRKIFGYRTESISYKPLRLIYWYLTFPIKILLAFIFNLNRTKNIWDTIQRRFIRLNHKS